MADDRFTKEQQHTHNSIHFHPFCVRHVTNHSKLEKYDNNPT